MKASRGVADTATAAVPAAMAAPVAVIATPQRARSTGIGADVASGVSMVPPKRPATVIV